jgi:hypothetical protein
MTAQHDSMAPSLPRRFHAKRRFSIHAPRGHGHRPVLRSAREELRQVTFSTSQEIRFGILMKFHDDSPVKTNHTHSV